MKRKLLYFVEVLTVVLAVSSLIIYIRTPSLNINVIDEMKPLTGNDRIIVFAPHCDDETLGAGGLLMKAVELGVAVKVVIVTNGDNNLLSTEMEFKAIHPSAKDYIKAGENRQQESLKAMDFIGVSRDDVLFLCYPDRGIKALYTTNWPVHNPFRSHATKDSSSPYKMCYEPGTIYAGENVLRDIKHILQSFKPTIIVSPHPEDRHPDHKYTFEFINQAAKELYTGNGAVPKPELLAYLTHHRFYPRPSGLKPEEYLLPPFSHTFIFGWLQFPMEDDVRDKKYDAIRLYRSQIVTPELGRLMRGFVRKNELFERLPIE